MQLPIIDSILMHKVDTIQLGVNQLLYAQQIQSAKMDSLCAKTNIDSLGAQLESISKYGIGYSDSIAHIAIPLIIALFAFAFPFLFMVISHINNKYKSENITKMLSSEASYKCFMGGAIACALFLFFASCFATCLNDDAYGVYMKVMNVMSVIVSGVYSAFIIWFVFKCVSYNSPQKVLKRIGTRFDSKSKECILKTIKEEKRIYREEYNRIYRYIDLCKYAVNIQDYRLFVDVLKQVSGLRHKRKNLENLNYVFYEQVVDSYLFGKTNVMMETSIMNFWFSTFNKSEIPNLNDVNRMLVRIVNAIQQGRGSLFEKYLLKANEYNFIRNLPILSYVKGENVEVQKEVDEKRIRIWDELSVIHNLAFAHLFSLGYNEVVRIIQLGDNTGYDRLMPGTGTEVLKLFAKCKDKQSQDGSFRYFAVENVIGKNTDPHMLEKYAAIMLLLSSTKRYDALRPISPNHLQKIIDSKNEIIKYGELWQRDAKLLNLFPQIVNTDIQGLIEGYIKWFEGKEDEHKKKEIINNEKKCLISQMVDGLLSKRDKSKKIQEITREKNIYKKELLKSEKEGLESGYINMLVGNRGYMFDYLYGPNSKEKTESAEMGAYTFLLPKQLFVERQGKNYNLDVFGDAGIFQSRYFYILMDAFQKMKTKTDAVQIGNLKRYVKDFLGNNGEHYVIIDIGAPRLLLSLDNDETFSKATYKHYDYNFGWYLKDLKELESFNNTMIIIKKVDLPCLCSNPTQNDVDVYFDDISDENQGRAEVRVTVNPNYVVKYNKNVEIRKIKVETLLREVN